MGTRAIRTGALSRLALCTFAAVFASLICLQFYRILRDNFAMSASLGAVQAQVGALREHERRDLRALRRLRDPRGAIPEIHERLRLVAPNEAIIYVKRARGG